MLLSRLFKTNVGRVFAKLHSGATNGVGGKSEREAVHITLCQTEYVFLRHLFISNIKCFKKHQKYLIDTTVICWHPLSHHSRSRSYIEEWGCR